MFDPEAAAGPSAGQLPSPSLAEQESRLEANNSVRRRIAESYPFSPQQQEHLGELGDLEDEARDPLLLKNKIYQPPARARPSLSRTSSLKSVYDSGKSGKLHAFYEYQNERIRDFLKPLVKHAQEAKDEQEAHRRPVQIAVYASLVFNSVLAILQLYSAIASLSLAFFASAIDAIFDPAVTILLWALTLKVKRADPQRYPAGGSRLLNVGSAVYSLVMAGASVILIVQCIQDIATHKAGEVNEFFLVSTIIVGIAVVTKFCLFLYCFTCRTYGPECRVLYEDHRNDLVLNSFALICNALGAKLRWWIDPAGAIVISVGLIYLWGDSARRELMLLCGIAAPKEIQQLVIYKAMTFSQQIIQVDSCKVYHSGTNYVVEVDIVMPPETTLAISHDISQILQDQLETLPQIERCFVHVDHETSHTPEHRKVI